MATVYTACLIDVIVAKAQIICPELPKFSDLQAVHLALHLFLPPISPSDNRFCLPRLISRENKCMAPYYFFKRTLNVHLLCIRDAHAMAFDSIDGEHKLTCQSVITTFMGTTRQL